jgi:hypothetical protein
MKFLRKWNEALLSPLALLILAVTYYLIYLNFGPEAGLIPPGYVTQFLLGGCVLYIGGFMASFSMKLNFPPLFKHLFEDDHIITNSRTILSVCVYFGYYFLAVWSLHSAL